MNQSNVREEKKERCVPLLFQMRTMADETEPRMCDEDFGSEEEGDVESYLEDNSSELMDRLRELEVALGSNHRNYSSASAFMVTHTNRFLHRLKTRL